MNGGTKERDLFGQVLLDVSRGRLFLDGSEVDLRPKAFELLSYLMRNAGRVVSKDELLAAVWPHVIVTEDSLTRCVHEVRRALGEAGGMLRTVTRRGYVLDHTAPDPSAPSAAGPEPAAVPIPALPLRPDGIGVLPFVLGEAETPAQAMLIDGLTHDVITGLARLRGFHVIARASTFALRHLTSDPQAAGRAMGVAHVVTGTARIRSGRLRLIIDIVDAGTGGIIWTGEFAEDLRGYADVIGALTDRIALTLHRQIRASEIRRALGIPPGALTAWEHFHQGLARVYSSDPAQIGQALGHFSDAARLSPGFAQAHAGQSVCHWVLAYTGMSADPAADAAAARQTAEAGIAADPEDPYSHWSLGRALGLAGDLAGNLRQADRSIALSPSFAFGHFEITLGESMFGDANRAMTHAGIFLALSPFDPAMYSAHCAIAHTHLRLGEMDRAAKMARSAAALGQDFPLVLAPSALILAEAGEMDEARRITARALALMGRERLAPLVANLSPQLAALVRQHGPGLDF